MEAVECQVGQRRRGEDPETAGRARRAVAPRLGSLLARLRRFGGRLAPGASPTQWMMTCGGLLLWAAVSWEAADGALRVTPDGKEYLRRAEAFSEGDLLWRSLEHGSYSVDQLPPTHFPPLYPALLAAFDHLPGLPVTTWAAILNVGCCLALVLGLLRLAVALGGTEDGGRWRRNLLAGACALVPASPNVVNATTSLLTEMIYFAVWVWMIVLVLERRPGNSRRALLVLACLAAVALLDRYIALSAVVGIAVCLAAMGSSRVRGAARAAGFLAISAVPLVAWATAMGGIRQERRSSDLSWVQAGWDSVVSMGAELAHLGTMRIGGVGGRTAVRLAEEPHPGWTTFAGRVGILVLVLAGSAILARVVLRRVPDDPYPMLALATGVGVLLPLLFRIRLGHVYLDRYWGLAPTFLVLIAIGRPGAGRIERLAWTAALLGVLVWTVLGRTGI